MALMPGVNAAGQEEQPGVKVCWDLALTPLFLAVIHLVQVDETKYPFSSRPPAYVRAQLYKYWFTESTKDG